MKKLELTKEEVAQMIKEAIEKDRHERLEDSVNQIVDTADIDSPGYNVSRLFSQERSTYKQKISELFHKEGYETVGPKGEELNFNEYRILDIVRELVLIGYNAKSNYGIPINHRREAQKHFRNIAEELYQMLQKTFS